MEFKKCQKEGFEIITPDRARKLLENNYEHNRAISQANVARIREDILNGTWNPIRSYWSDSIIVSNSGKLLNGQHRLSAIIQSGRNIKIWVKYGAPEELYAVLDDNKRRSLGDVIDGKNRNNLAALSNFAYCVEDGNTLIGSVLIGFHKTGSRDKGVVPSREAGLEKYNLNQEFFTRCVEVGTNARKKLGFAPSKLAKVYYFISKFDGEEHARTFFDELVNDDTDYQSIRAYKNYVYQCIIKKRKMDYRWMFLTLLYTYFKYSKNEDIKTFSNYETVEKRLNTILTKIREENL